MAFAIFDLLKPGSDKKKIVLTRPIVEAGESLGYLPGDFHEKVNPYMLPLLDCLSRCVPEDSPQRERINEAIEIAPIAYMRGRTFDDAICIFDEAQNATMDQIKMFLTRIGRGSTCVINGDLRQSDLEGPCALQTCMDKLEGLEGVSIVELTYEDIIRNNLISKVLSRLEQ